MGHCIAWECTAAHADGGTSIHPLAAAWYGGDDPSSACCDLCGETGDRHTSCDRVAAGKEMAGRCGMYAAPVPKIVGGA